MGYFIEKTAAKGKETAGLIDRLKYLFTGKENPLKAKIVNVEAGKAQATKALRDLKAVAGKKGEEALKHIKANKGKYGLGVAGLTGLGALAYANRDKLFD